MSLEEFYGNNFSSLKTIQKKVMHIFNKLSYEFQDYPLYYSSRIKSVSSMKKKLSKRGVPIDENSAIYAVNDALGFRIVCRWSDDVYKIADWLKKCPELKVKKIKDYIAYPKPNGYRSYHLIVSLPEMNNINFEIQIRTIAMDIWSNMEHDTQYKKQKKYKNGKLTKALKKCSDDIAALDHSLLMLKKISHSYKHKA